MRLIALTAALIALPAFAQTAEKPAKVAVCAACHGESGVPAQPQMYPTLAGQQRSYLVHALEEYRAGLRKNPIMGAQASSLTDTDIHELALYFSSLQGPLYTPRVAHPNEPAAEPAPGPQGNK